MRPVLIPLKPVSSNNLLKYSLNKSELILQLPKTMPKAAIFNHQVLKNNKYFLLHM